MYISIYLYIYIHIHTYISVMRVCLTYAPTCACVCAYVRACVFGRTCIRDEMCEPYPSAWIVFWLGAQAFNTAEAFNANISLWNTASLTNMDNVCAAFGRQRVTWRPRSAGFDSAGFDVHTSLPVHAIFDGVLTMQPRKS